MEISLIWNIFFVTALSQGLFVTAILFSQYLKTSHLSSLFLSLFLLAFSFNLLNNIIYWNGAMGSYPQFIFSTVSIRFLFAPLFYWYCLLFLKGSFEKKALLHLLPFILITIIYSPVLFLSGADKIAIITSSVPLQNGGIAFIYKSINWLLSLQLVAYPILIFYQINQYLKTQNTAIDKNKKNQLRCIQFLNGLFFLYGALMLFYYILVFLDIGGIEKDYYISLVMCLAIYSISYFSMIDPDLLKGEKFLDRIQNLKYSRTKLDENYLDATISQLEQLMQQEEVYLEPSLNLNQVAKKIEIPRHHISQALSLRLHKTFPEYLNSYRIRHACQMLRQLADGNNVKTVMYDSGFNNRTSFNNNFKKFMGMTATEFLKQQASPSENK